MTTDKGYLNIRGVKHYYEWIRQSDTSSTKPVMVFIHGWGGSGRYWETTAKALSNEFDCLLYDMRGFGRSKLPKDPLELAYDMEDYADDLAILLDQLGLDSVYLNGHSMGASVATIFLNRYPNRVKRAILTCSGIFEYDAKTFTTFHTAASYVVKLRYKWFLRVPFADKLFMARFLHRPIAKKVALAFLEDYIAADLNAAVGTIYTSVSQKAAEEMPGEFAKLTVPTLLVAGEKDIIIPAAMGREAAAKSEMVEYFEIPQTAHFPMLEDAPTYLKRVREFLEIPIVESAGSS